SHWHPHVCQFIRRLNAQGMDALLATDTQQLSNDSLSAAGLETLRFNTEYAPTVLVAKPRPRENVDFKGGAYSIYNWELFFHVPLLIATRLSKDKQFQQAQRWFHYIFNPLDSSGEASPARFWKFLPFKTTPAQRILDLLQALGYKGTEPAIVELKRQVEAQ